MISVPVLMITYNRLEYTKRAFDALLASDVGQIIIIDNGSTDGTQDWLWAMRGQKVKLYFNRSGTQSIAGAMNTFLELTKDAGFVAKVDNDTIIPSDFIARMLPHMRKADVVQAKHPILKATHPGGFDEWVSKMPSDGPLRFNHFVGGSGIVFRRDIVDHVPETNWVLGGWRHWQRLHPQVKKAFATDVSIELLDTTEDGPDYSQYPEYYRQTKRL